MNAWSAQTGKNGDGWKYQYSAATIRGFGQTHQCSPWVNDYAVFTLMPVAGTLVVDENKRAAAFHHENETARPDYYKVSFDNGVTTEITPTERGAAMRFSYPLTADGYLVLDGYTKLSSVHIDAAHRRITGWVNNARWAPAGFKNFFVLEFDQPFAGYGTWENEKNTIFKDSTGKEGKGAGAWLQFTKGAVVQVKIASSYISPEQAVTTLHKELGPFTGFDDARKAAQQV
jgi:putative alpha-1,2-mannosidase